MTPYLTGRRPRYESGSAPVHPLGHIHSRFHFFDHAGRFVELGPNALGRGPSIRALFGDADGAKWLQHRFPALNKRGKPADGFNIGDCHVWLVERCVARGLFDPDRLPVRGHGVWLAQGVVAVHVGTSVIFMVTDGRPPVTRATWFGDRARYGHRSPSAHHRHLHATPKRRGGLSGCSVNGRGQSLARNASLRACGPLVCLAQ